MQRTFAGKIPGVALSLILVAGCWSDAAMAPLPEGNATFTVTNSLIAPVTISIDGTPYAILGSGRTTSLTLPWTTRLTWTSAKPADMQGQRIPDEIGEQHVDVAGISGALEFTNVIGDQTYFTARIFNFTDLRVSIGVWDGGKVWCASVLPEASTTAPGFTVIGYYRLLPATEMRAYTESTNCTGRYVAWPSSQLTGFEAKSGLLTLRLDPT